MLYENLNVRLITQLKIKISLKVIFLISTILILTFNLSAQEREKEKGYKGPISKERMRSIFSKGETVDGYTIKGVDIIEIIKETDFEIKIRRSIIEGGLDFGALIAVPLEKENLPEDWSEKEKEAFIERMSVGLNNIQIVKNKIDITSSDIGAIDAFGTIFNNEIIFERTTFSKGAWFLAAAFGDAANFKEAVFSDRASFRAATFSGEANFGRAIFNNYAEFQHGTTFSDRAIFSGAVFNGRAFFWEAIFSGEAYFEEAAFSNSATFSRAIFSGGTDFEEAAFSDMANFSRTTFSGMALFLGTDFSGPTDFVSADFSDAASFRAATFSNVANFNVAIFNKLAYFTGANFFGDLELAHSVFKEYADFRESKIRRLNYNSVLSPTIIEGRIDFRKAIISEAHFQDLIFEKDVDFSDAKFGIPIITVRLEKLPLGVEFPDSLKDKIHYKANAKFLIFVGFMTDSEKEELAGLSEDIKYKNAIEQIFLESASSIFAIVFRYIKFESDAYFLRTEFSGDTAFERVTLKNEANFTDADFKNKRVNGKQNFSLSYLNLKNLLIKWGQFPNPEFWASESKDRIMSFIDIEEEKRKKELSKEEQAGGGGDEVKKKGKEEISSGERLEPLSQVFKGLEANFRDQKQLSDANKAYYYRKKAEFKEERNSKVFWEWFPKQALWSIWWISCGYGTKNLWILGWIFFFDLLFAMLYSFKNNLNKQTHPETGGEFSFKQRLLDFPRLYLSEAKPLDMIKSKFTITFINALRFSSVVLLKVGYRDTKIYGKILGINCKYFVWAEWLLGFYLLACLTITMSNTIPIINSLISGIF